MIKIKQPHGWAIVQAQKWETANPNGRPRKGISLVNKQLEQEWYSPASKADIETNYMAMLQLEEKKLSEMVTDKSQPMLIRILAKNMLSGKGFDIIEKMLDRGIWKPKQTNEIDVTTRDYTIVSNLEDIPPIQNTQKKNKTTTSRKKAK